MLENKKIDLLEFKNFVNETVKEELEDYSTEELEDFVNDNLDYDILVEIAYKDFIKGYNATAKEAIINEVFTIKLKNQRKTLDKLNHLW